MGKLILILIAVVLDGFFTLLIHSLAVYVIWNFLLVDITGVTIDIGDAVGALAIIYSIISYAVICNGKATGTLKYLEKTKV